MDHYLWEGICNTGGGLSISVQSMIIIFLLYYLLD